jgi:hypothetical protein
MYRQIDRGSFGCQLPEEQFSGLPIEKEGFNKLKTQDTL